NSVVVLENIFRHMELGEPPAIAAEKGGNEVALPVLAATLATAVVFFPVIYLYGVSKFLFSALALAVVLSLFASYVVALTVVPLFCAKLLRPASLRNKVPTRSPSVGQRFERWFNTQFTRLVGHYDTLLAWALSHPGATTGTLLGVFVLSLGLVPFVGISYFPKT